MPWSIVTSRLGGQEWRRTETPDAVGVRARRWVVRLGLVLAAGAAGMAVTAGAAQADSGLGGTLDHVAKTVEKVTGSSHSSGSHASGSHAASRGSKASSGTHASSSSHRAGSVRVTVRRAPVRTVARPVVRTVQRAAKPVVQQTRPTAPVTTKTHPAKAPRARVKVQAKASVEVPALRADALALDLVVHPQTVAVGVDLPRVELPRVGLPRVDLPRVDLPAVGLPPTPVTAPVPALVDRADTRAVGFAASTYRGTPLAASSTSAAPPTSFARHVTTAETARVVPALTALGRVAATATYAGLWAPPTGTGDNGSPGTVPGGATAGGGATGALLLGLAVAAGLATLRSAHGRIPDGLAPEAFRLPRQPGFAPD